MSTRAKTKADARKKTLGTEFRANYDHSQIDGWILSVPAGTEVRYPEWLSSPGERQPSTHRGQTGRVIETFGRDFDEAGAYLERIRIEWEDGGRGHYSPEFAADLEVL